MNTTLLGTSFIAGTRGSVTGQTFAALNPTTGETLSPAYHEATAAEVDRACAMAGESFKAYRAVAPAKRAAFLREMAGNMEAIGNALLDRFVAETGLPRGRAEGERARTCAQLRMFADVIEKPDWNRPSHDVALPDRKPLPRPDMKLHYVPIGPVAVFGPANFPLAYTVAGGDSASALAAGCPVVVKAHSSHPGTSELVAIAVDEAVKRCGLPPGVFSVVFGGGRTIGQLLVDHPAIAAVGFTGSEAVGRGLFDRAARRPVPIPVFAEMSSINPVILLPGALQANLESIATAFVQSLTLGVGQFCTNPGLVLLPGGELGRSFATRVAELLAPTPAAPMLNVTTAKSYHQGLADVGSAGGVQTLLKPSPASGPAACHAKPALFATAAADFVLSHRLREEVFGPASLLVWCDTPVDFDRVLSTLGGQLTATVHASGADHQSHAEMIASLDYLAGRVIFGGFPTGLEVCGSTVHGGPYPATTDGRFTSVGTRAIDRFLRPVCHQNAV
jgi:2,5-dioxopentanoate dehydrogenase